VSTTLAVLSAASTAGQAGAALSEKKRISCHC